MTTDKKETSTKPPYISFKTFYNFIASLRQSSIPNRIDRSILPGLSGANQSFLISALKFFGLIEEDGAPTASLKELVQNEKSEKAVLGRLLADSYHFIINPSFDFKSATESQLEEKFREKDLSGQTVRKCVSFFLALCEKAGIQTSPHLRSKRGTSNGGNVPKRKYKKRLQPEEAQAPVDKGPAAPGNSLQAQLLAKFPDFNPEWPQERQDKWFASFEQFMKVANAPSSSQKEEKA